jgi:hypothetical protein
MSALIALIITTPIAHRQSIGSFRAGAVFGGCYWTTLRHRTPAFALDGQ